MKWTLLIIACGLTGCYSPPTTGNPAVAAPARGPLLPVTASALAFDPPVALAGPMPDLSREGRSPAAFVGYESAITDSSFVVQRDQQRFSGRGDSSSDFSRSAYSGKSSTMSR